MRKLLIIFTTILLLLTQSCVKSNDSNPSTENTAVLIEQNIKVENVTEPELNPSEFDPSELDPSEFDPSEFVYPHGAKGIDFETITFTSTDGTVITADMYACDDSNKFIILGHQFRMSRGEYRESALFFNDLGYNAIALDLRGGDMVNEVTNLTEMMAFKDESNFFHYTDYLPLAYLDMIAGINYTYETYSPDQLVVLGSSYSASFSLIIASKFHNQIDAVIAFSPDPDLFIDDVHILDYISNISVPAFITSASYESTNWQALADAIPDKHLTAYISDQPGGHGSTSLWSSKKGFEGYRQAIMSFLNKL